MSVSQVADVSVFLNIALVAFLSLNELFISARHQIISAIN